MNTMSDVEIAGFKSFKDARLSLGRINVLIGANGSGKSNFISFLRLLNYGMTEAMQTYVGTEGGANSLLFYGSRTTPQITANLTFETNAGRNSYHVRLFHAAPDTLLFAEESLSFQRKGREGPPFTAQLGAGHLESRLKETSEKGERRAVRETASVLRAILSGCRVFQFHDTSREARIRMTGYIDDNRFLKSDASNLPSFLFMLKERHSDYYRRIVQTIQQCAPFFGDFDLAPSPLNPRTILLNWKERDSDLLFGPHQISDGTLRFMALATLLLQPRETSPDILIIDEPELGLHPLAIQVLASLLKEKSHSAQVIVATQSPTLVDHFQPEDVVVVERCMGESVFRPRLTEEALAEWLEEYSLGELWQKNVTGGHPSR
ncbi:MAG: AAA family ATPase [Candidatus Sumerlaeota bacterium]|nr:AAA family ATPase [Candidatus Sumerlaeota bacterium]